MSDQIRCSIRETEDIGTLCEIARSMRYPAGKRAHLSEITRRLRKICHDPEYRIAFTGNITWQPTDEYVHALLLAEGIASQGLHAPYGQFIQQALNSSSEIYRFDPALIVLALDMRVLSPQIHYGFESMMDDDIEKASQDIVNSIRICIEKWEEGTDAHIVVTNFILPRFISLGIADQKRDNPETEFYRKLNRELERIGLESDRVQILDLDRLASIEGIDHAMDDRMYYIAKQPWTDRFCHRVANAICSHALAAKGVTKKCLVLDLDNTLWGGVLGEDGIEGIRIGQGDPVGEAFLEFQARLKSIKARGVILALCSKNNEHEVMDAFRLRSDMPLKLEDFSVTMINWNPKADNIAEISRILNIGLDSMVFMDDSDMECELMRRSRPEVEVLQIPSDPASIPAVVERIPGVERIRILAEDVSKTEMYRQNAMRERQKKNSTNLEEYLRDLETWVEVGLADQSQLSRIHQLHAKTNQFNLTTRRLSIAEIESRMRSPDWDVFAVNSGDRFGELGLIASAVIQVDRSSSCARIDTLMMSCRALGRGIETVLMNHMKIRYFEDLGLSAIEASFIPTGRNIPAKDYLIEQGFELLDTDDYGGQHYRLVREKSTLRRCDWLVIRNGS